MYMRGWLLQIYLLGFLPKRSDLREAFGMVNGQFKNLRHWFCPYQPINIWKLHSDGAVEYKALENYFGGGMCMEKSFSLPYIPELNAIAERINL